MTPETTHIVRGHVGKEVKFKRCKAIDETGKVDRNWDRVTCKQCLRLKPRKPQRRK